MRSSEACLYHLEDFVVVDFNCYRTADPSSALLKQDTW
jgi:hypothetical protein